MRVKNICCIIIKHILFKNYQFIPALLSEVYNLIPGVIVTVRFASSISHNEMVVGQYVTVASQFFNYTHKVHFLQTSFPSGLSEIMFSLQKTFFSGKVTDQSPPLFKLDTSFCFCESLLSSFPVLRMAIACWLSSEFTL